MHRKWTFCDIQWNHRLKREVVKKIFYYKNQQMYAGVLILFPNRWWQSTENENHTQCVQNKDLCICENEWNDLIIDHICIAIV